MYTQVEFLAAYPPPRGDMGGKHKAWITHLKSMKEKKQTTYIKNVEHEIYNHAHK